MKVIKITRLFLVQGPIGSNQLKSNPEQYLLIISLTCKLHHNVIVTLVKPLPAANQKPLGELYFVFVITLKGIVCSFQRHPYIILTSITAYYYRQLPSLSKRNSCLIFMVQKLPLNMNSVTILYIKEQRHSTCRFLPYLCRIKCITIP